MRQMSPGPLQIRRETRPSRWRSLLVTGALAFGWCLLAAGGTAAGFGGEPPSLPEVTSMNGSSPAASGAMGVDDLFATGSYASLAISPDGRWLAFTLRRADEKANEWQADLWRLDLQDASAKPLRLTRGEGSVSAVAWSPDSRWIAFITTRSDGDAGKDDEPKPQIWRIAPDGGEAEALSSWKPGVKGFAWAGENRILFWAHEKETLRERKLKEAKDDTRVVEDVEHWPPVRLFSLDLQKKKVVRLTDNVDHIDRLWVREDGRAWVTRHITSIYWESQPGGPWPRYFLHEEDEGGASDREIFREPTFHPSRVAFLPDGNLLAQYAYSRRTTEDFRSEAAIETLWQVDPRSDERVRVDEREMGLDEHLRGPTWWVTGKSVVAVLADRVHGRPVRFTRRGGHWKMHELKGPQLPNWTVAAVDRSGERVAWVYSSADEPERLYVGRLDGNRVHDERLVHDPNEALAAKTGRSEVVSWKSSLDGTEITGILTVPREGAGPHPLMVWIHGGPTGVDADVFENYWASFPHILAGMGIATLQPNYRGSINHGLDYVEAITGGKYYELEIPDILDGVDAMIERGIAHPDSLGAIGWSNGAILSIALTVKSDRFRVCCAGAGDVNWTSDFGNCAFGPNFDIGYLGDTPWGNPQLYVDKSPLFAMEKVTTPTLIQFGEKDTSVPTSQGWEHYRALQIIGKAPVRFLLYPGMPHGLSKLSYQRRKVREELRWIGRYLLGRPPVEDEILKEGSPLACAMEQAAVIDEKSGRVGVQKNGLLVPPLAEPALKSGVRLAAVELTRGMLAAALDDSSMKECQEALTALSAEDGSRAGDGDLPATGMGFECARAYARWLADKTGENWRLPTREELQEAAELFQRSPAENTLDRWAGYEPTFDEALSLRERMGKDEDLTRWLRPVASSGANRPRFDPALGPPPEPSCYDLHGNAAVWCIDPDGQGVIFGRCALDPSAGEFDSSSAGDWPTPPPELVGIRLVFDPTY